MRTIAQTMLKGLLAILPIGLTVYLVYWLGVAGEEILVPLLKALLPKGVYRPGFGLVTGLALLYVVGLVVNAWAVKSALRLTDDLIGRIPVVKTLYFAIRDFTRFFPSTEGKSDLKRVVLIAMGPGKAIGFVTAEAGAGLSLPPMSGGGIDDLIAVYMPMSYTVGGYTVFVHRHDIEPIDLSVEAAMRLVLMGGVQGAAPTTAPMPAPTPAVPAAP
jgi:uncharacterized membrane protein